MKQCSKCGELKEDSLFSIGRNQCKECRKQFMKQYAEQYCQSHKEELKQYDKQYYQSHTEEINQRCKQYRLEHIEELKQYAKQYRLEHMEELKQQYKQYRKSKDGKLVQKKRNAKKRNMKYISLMNNPFPDEIIVEDHHVLTNFHAIDANNPWNKWFVIPMPKITHQFVHGLTNNLEHWRHNEEWIRKLYDININELLGNTLEDG